MVKREWVLQAVREAAGVGAEAEGVRDTVTVRLSQAEKAWAVGTRGLRLPERVVVRVAQAVGAVLVV